MRTRSLQSRFALSGLLLVAITVGSGVWSAFTFARLSAAVKDALRASQQQIDLAAEMAGSLEREDDALLLALGGEAARARRELEEERRHSDACYRRLADVLVTGGDTGPELA